MTETPNDNETPDDGKTPDDGEPGPVVIANLNDFSIPEGLKNNPPIRSRRGTRLHLTLLGQRFLLAAAILLLTSILALLILCAAFFVSDTSYQQVKELAPIVFTPIVTLLGTSVAWYFASDAKQNSQDQDL